MITVFLRGGLGNQMFEYAAGLHLAKKNGVPLLLDTVFLNDRFPRKEFAYRNYDLGIFALESNFTALSGLSSRLPVPGIWLAADIALIKAREVLGVQRILWEKQDHVFDPKFLQAPGDTLLWGRWQNEKYFADIAEAVRAAFQFRSPLQGAAEAIGREIRSTDSAVSLHVRRGDYAAFKGLQELHGKTNLSYYTEAVRYMAARVPNPHFFVFSDDVAWCRANLHIEGRVTYVPAEAAGPHDGYHLELMSLCKHHIITNSTFSWWGAWLDPRPQKRVVAPAQWYADREQPPDVVPAGWIRL